MLKGEYKKKKKRKRELKDLIAKSLALAKTSDKDAK